MRHGLDQAPSNPTRFQLLKGLSKMTGIMVAQMSSLRIALANAV
jgi:hypothetical protein